MVPDTERTNHDNWHEWLTQQLGLRAVTVVAFDGSESSESDSEMLRRLLREVMELSERME